MIHYFKALLESYKQKVLKTLLLCQHQAPVDQFALFPAQLEEIDTNMKQNETLITSPSYVDSHLIALKFTQ